MPGQNLNNEIYNTPEITEEMAALAQSNEQQQELRREIERDKKYKGFFRRLTFHYNTSNILENGRNIIYQLSEKFKDDDSSLEGILFNNSQVKKLLSNIVNSQVKTIHEEKIRCERLLAEILGKNQENNNEDGLQPEIWEQYKINNLQLENFENFILSDDGISVIVRELKKHINPETGDFYPNYPVSEEILKRKLNNAWNNSLYGEYCGKNGIYTDEKKDNIDRIGNIVEDGIDDIVGDYIKSGGKIFNRELINKLESTLSDSGDYESIDNLLKDSEYRDVFKELLKNKIVDFSELAFKGDKVSLTTPNTQINLQLRSYLYMYGKFFYPGIFKTNQGTSYYEDTLVKIMEAILVADGDERLKGMVKYNEFLEQERKAEQERRERDRKRRVAIAQRNKERNDHLQSAPKMDRQSNITEVKTVSSNPDDATGAEIAAEANLGKDLDNYNINIEESDKKEKWIKETAFSDAWKKFIEAHEDLKTIITQEQMRQIFDFDNNSLNNYELENFIKINPLLKELSPDKIEKIRTTLSSFPSSFDEAKKRLLNDSSEMKEKMNETVKTYAIGAVIDNVRDTFDTINEDQAGEFEGFHLDNSTPVEKNGNDIIISGSFNGSDVKVRYDLETGDLFMNSFLHKLSPSKISIGIDSSIDYPIGKIKPFNDVLNDYYKLPPHSTNRKMHNGINPEGKPGRDSIDGNQIPSHGEMEQKDNWRDKGGKAIGTLIESQKDRTNANLKKKEANKILNSQIGLIGEAIKLNTENQAQKNSAIIEFMKTFNIVSSSGRFSKLDFNDGSNLFDLIQILDNSDSIKLEYFNNTFMPKMMEYAGLKWGARNERQNKSTKKSERIFNYDGDNENIKYLRDKTKDFNPDQFSGIANFESSHQLGFVDLIKEKITLGSKPNWKLDVPKMEQFIKSIESRNDENPDSALEKKLSNI